MRLTSVAMTDSEFLTAIENCRYPIADFHHVEHLRLGWLLLSKMDLAPASTCAARTLRRFTQHYGRADRYHETITQAWMRLLSSHEEREFCEFLALHGHRVALALLHRHWRRETLRSDAARAAWVELRPRSATARQALVLPQLGRIEPAPKTSSQRRAFAGSTSSSSISKSSVAPGAISGGAPLSP